MMRHNVSQSRNSNVMYVIYCVLGLYAMNEWFRTLRSMYGGGNVMYSECSGQAEEGQR
jgi:hypothetical protein